MSFFNAGMGRVTRTPLVLLLLFSSAAQFTLPAAISSASLQLSDDVHTQVYRQVSAAVVGITCKNKEQKEDEPGEFFGTGVVVAPDGLILTCITVVPATPRDIKVYFVDGRVMPGELVRVDKTNEGVLIRVDAKKLTAMRLADSSNCKVGDPAYSWGNPFHTIMKDGMVSLSSGTISGIYMLSSVDPESRYLGPVLETDAAVNPGSDGGPLTDADGNLLGLQSLAFSRSRWLGTAVPVHQLAKGLPELKPLIAVRKVSFTGAKARVWAIERAFPQVAEKVATATVSIRVVREGESVKLPERRQDEKVEPLAPFPNDLRRNLKELARPTGAFASGVIVDPSGLVLTAAYNLGDEASGIGGRQGTGRGGGRNGGRGGKANTANTNRNSSTIKAVHVFLADGTRVPAKLLGRDSFYDVAALQLEGPAGRSYPYVPLANAETLVVGRYVAVLGRSEPPGDLTLNCGPVSATNRFQKSCDQINAMVNYGNLGGPVIDLHGRLVGLAVRLSERTDWRQNCGVAFLIKAEVINQILPDLKAGKRLDRPMRTYLGVQGDVGALDIKGARINSVMPNSPASDAGLEKGDVIYEFNGAKVEDWLTLVQAIQNCKIGQTVKLKLRRGKEEKEMEFEVTLSQIEYM